MILVTKDVFLQQTLLNSIASDMGQFVYKGVFDEDVAALVPTVEKFTLAEMTPLEEMNYYKDHPNPLTHKKMLVLKGKMTHRW